MSSSSLLAKSIWIDALSVIPHAQPKLTLAIMNFHFDLLCKRVLESISHRFDSNPISLIANDRSEIPRCAFDMNTELRRIPAGFIGNEFFANRADRAGNVVGNLRGRT